MLRLLMSFSHYVFNYYMVLCPTTMSRVNTFLSLLLYTVFGRPPKPPWTQRSWGGSSLWPASGGMNRESLQLFMPWMTCGCLLYGTCVLLTVMFLTCQDVTPKSLWAWCSDGQMHQATVSKPDREEIQPRGIWTQRTHERCIAVTYSESDSSPPHINTYSAYSFSADIVRVCCGRGVGLCLFWLIRSAVETQQSYSQPPTPPHLQWSCWW